MPSSTLWNAQAFSSEGNVFSRENKASEHPSDRVNFLRDQIARIEAKDTCFSSPMALARVPLGQDCSLDSVLQGGLARGALHEIVAAHPGDFSAASSFALALAIRFTKALARPQANLIWIIEHYAMLEHGAPFGPGLCLHGVDPERLLIIHTFNAQESLWAMEEALKSSSAAVVLLDLWNAHKAYDLTASRRLILAAQKSGTPALVFAAGMPGKAELLSTGAQTRFEIAARPSPALPTMANALPLPGLAAWSARLIKARDGPQNLDPDKIFALLWDHEEALFRDMFPRHFTALSRHRSARSAHA